MLKLLHKVPRAIGVAVSGGPDSMAALSFLKSNHDVIIYHFNHGTHHGEIAERFVVNYAEENNIPFRLGRISSLPPKGRSKEDFWREERYKFLDSFDTPIVIAHTLDDVVETWVMSSLHGQGKIIPYQRGRCFRPFLLCSKADMLDWNNWNGVPFVLDEGNEDEKYNRVKVRHLMPDLLRINPGLYKVVRKKILGGHNEGLA